MSGFPQELLFGLIFGVILLVQFLYRLLRRKALEMQAQAQAQAREHAQARSQVQAAAAAAQPARQAAALADAHDTARAGMAMDHGPATAPAAERWLQPRAMPFASALATAPTPGRKPRRFSRRRLMPNRRAVQDAVVIAAILQPCHAKQVQPGD